MLYYITDKNSLILNKNIIIGMKSIIISFYKLYMVINVHIV